MSFRLNSIKQNLLNLRRQNILSKCCFSTDKNLIKIGCASGFWGDTPTASEQLVNSNNVDYIVYDYLSEITMSLLTAAQAKKPELGFAPDFVLDAIGPLLIDIKRKGIRIISNAGGINPNGCAEALKKMCKKAGVDLKIAVVSGDNLMPYKCDYIGTADMNNKIALPKSIHSMNAYLGSEPIVKCLAMGADIVVTGRCADSSLALAPLVHSFGWKWDEWDLLASGSLAGHLIECGAQVTGGICTDWKNVPNWDNMGFPIAEVSQNGSVLVTKPAGTGGAMLCSSVAEQLLYEVGDPRNYVLPDVVCDFSQVTLHQETNGVRAIGAKGKPPTDSYKVCATYMDGFRATTAAVIRGSQSDKKARRVGQAVLARTRRLLAARGLPDFRRTHLEVLGAEDAYGALARRSADVREAVLWLAAHHDKREALDVMAKEIASAGTGMAPGLTALIGGRPKATPLLRLHSFLASKSNVRAQVALGDQQFTIDPRVSDCVAAETYVIEDQAQSADTDGLSVAEETHPLIDVAIARSGDKGDSCNVCVIARHPSLLPYIQAALTKQAVANLFQQMIPELGDDFIKNVKRYEVPGVHALNFVLDRSLGGGGVASLRSDPQGKAFAQMMLAESRVPCMPQFEQMRHKWEN